VTGGNREKQGCKERGREIERDRDIDIERQRCREAGGGQR